MTFNNSSSKGEKKRQELNRKESEKSVGSEVCLKIKIRILLLMSKPSFFTSGFSKGNYLMYPSCFSSMINNGQA